jgi:hypothetical protein
MSLRGILLYLKNSLFYYVGFFFILCFLLLSFFIIIWHRLLQQKHVVFLYHKNNNVSISSPTVNNNKKKNNNNSDNYGNAVIADDASQFVNVKHISHKKCDELFTMYFLSPAFGSCSIDTGKKNNAHNKKAKSKNVIKQKNSNNEKKIEKKIEKKQKDVSQDSKIKATIKPLIKKEEHKKIQIHPPIIEHKAILSCDAKQGEHFDNHSNELLARDDNIYNVNGSGINASDNVDIIDEEAYAQEELEEYLSRLKKYLYQFSGKKPPVDIIIILHDAIIQEIKFGKKLPSLAYKTHIINTLKKIDIPKKLWNKKLLIAL